MKKTILGSIVLAGVLATNMFAMENMPNMNNREMKGPMNNENNLSSCMDKAESKEEFIECKNAMKERKMNCIDEKECMKNKQNFIRPNINEENFKEIKSNIIENLKKHINCVENSKNPEELKNCKPKQKMNKENRINNNKMIDKNDKMEKKDNEKDISKEIHKI